MLFLKAFSDMACVFYSKEKCDAMARLNKRRNNLKVPAYQRKPFKTYDLTPADIEQLLWHAHREGLSGDEYEDEGDDDFTDIQVPEDSPEENDQNTLKRLMQPKDWEHAHN